MGTAAGAVDEGGGGVGDQPTVAASSESTQLEYASLGERFAGQLVDGIFLAALVIPIFVLPESAAGGYVILWFLSTFVYTLVIEGLWDGKTVGKYIVGTRVVKDNGEGIGIGSSLVRNFVGLIGSAFGWLGLLVGAFAIYQSEENKRIGDSAAGTVVIEDK